MGIHRTEFESMLALTRKLPRTVRSRRDKALKKIIAKLRSGPVGRDDFQDMAHATYYDNTKRAIYLGVAKELADGRLARVDYSDLEEEMAEYVKVEMSRMGIGPSVGGVAAHVGRDPEDPEFKAALWKVAKRIGWRPAATETEEQERVRQLQATPYHQAHDGAEYVHNANKCPAPEKYLGPR